MKKIQFKDQSWIGLKTRSRDATLSRHKGININELTLHTRIAITPSVYAARPTRLQRRVPQVEDILTPQHFACGMYRLYDNVLPVIDEDLTARINMADSKFSFQEKGRVYSPAWMSPEALLKPAARRNWQAADMWSYAVLLWELATREIPFADLSPMECGMKVGLEGLRISIPPGVSPHIAKLIKICMHEDPGKRPTFDMILPILEKMKR
ncbi:Integrin-linked protein kinase [Operophtera brumata]|uniref:Integrin-linked protein kinase n=1 Tax=Operophtera brumata TaxID=104452 RepID=A0A0L7LLV2_OPEBR|nr:Integrin-linked protein kinase [Operophtera brumata]